MRATAGDSGTCSARSHTQPASPRAESAHPPVPHPAALLLCTPSTCASPRHRHRRWHPQGAASHLHAGPTWRIRVHSSFSCWPSSWAPTPACWFLHPPANTHAHPHTFLPPSPGAGPAHGPGHQRIGSFPLPLIHMHTFLSPPPPPQHHHPQVLAQRMDPDTSEETIAATLEFLDKDNSESVSILQKRCKGVSG